MVEDFSPYWDCFLYSSTGYDEFPLERLRCLPPTNLRVMQYGIILPFCPKGPPHGEMLVTTVRKFKGCLFLEMYPASPRGKAYISLFVWMSLNTEFFFPWKQRRAKEKKHKIMNDKNCLQPAPNLLKEQE